MNLDAECDFTSRKNGPRANSYAPHRLDEILTINEMFYGANAFD